MVVALVAAAVLLMFTAYLAAAETLVSRLDVVRAMRLTEEEARGGAALLWLTEHRATALSVLLVATVTARVALAGIAVLLGFQHLGGVPGAILGAAAVVLASLVLAEIVPRTLVARSVERAGGLLGGATRGLVLTLRLPAGLVVGSGRALLPRRFSGTDVANGDLDQVEADDEEHDEPVDPGERAMIRSIFGLVDTRVREIMVPRPDLVTVSEEAGLDEVVTVVNEHGLSRIPVHAAADPDQIVGVVYAKDLLARIATDRRAGWTELVREPTFVPETKRSDELLRELQAAAVHLALVVDEYGDLVGLVTIEDILEEIVGEITDEHDRVEPMVEVIDDQHWRVDARLGVDDFNELFGVTLPEEGWDTVGGLVFGTLGRVPVEGERVELDGVRLTVERVQGRRIAKVLVTMTGGTADAEQPQELTS